MKVVIGFGKTGLSCIQYLCNKGEMVTAMDSRDNPPNIDTIQSQFPKVKIIQGGLCEKTLLQADEMIISPGLSLKTPEIAHALAHGVACIGDIELFAREAKAPIIAITGSNGKTTLTTLVGQMLRDGGFNVEVCGNIGMPVLDVLNRSVPDFYVMELSSFQLETTYSLQAKVAIVLNITPDHMDRYDSLDDYAKAKLRIYNDCELAIVNADEPYTQNLNCNKQTLFSVTKTRDVNFYLADYNGQLFIFHEGTACFPVSELLCQGRHHYENALAALAIGYNLGISFDAMRNTLHHFSGLAHRCQKIASHQGVDWYNDSKATNIGATIAALNSLKPLYKAIILIAGGDAKGADLSALGPIAGNTVAHVVLMGAAADELAQILHDHVATTRVTNLSEAVATASHYAQTDTAVLLSPACASWDMFENFEERGNLFVSAVEEFINAQQSLA